MIQKLLQLIAERGMTVAEFCRRSGIPETTISTAKARGTNLSTLNLVRAAQALGVSLETLAGEEVDA